MIKWIIVMIGAIIILVSNTFMWKLGAIILIIATLSLSNVLSKPKRRLRR